MSTNELYMDHELRVERLEAGPALQLRFSGISAAPDPSRFLEPILMDAAQDALRLGKELVVDVTRLRRMNSSTVPPILRLIALAQTQPLRLRFVYDRQQSWQTLSFAVLKAFETIDRRISVSPLQ